MKLDLQADTVQWDSMVFSLDNERFRKGLEVEVVTTSWMLTGKEPQRTA